MPPVLHLNPAQLDLTHIVAGPEDIRRFNPQRFEMEQVSAVVFIDRERHVIAGYKDVGRDEFWVRGHMPQAPLMPGVLMCEAAAQICAYYVYLNNLTTGDFFGFGGLENVRFRGRVKPGDRLVMVGKMTHYHRRRITFNVQSFVGTTMVFDGDVIGLPLSFNEDA